MHQELEGFLVRLRGVQVHGAQAFKKHAQAVQGHEHQVVQAQTGQRLQMYGAPLRALGHKAPFWRQDCVGVGLAAHAPEQTFRFEPGAGTHFAGRVAAVFGQQHPDVHLVGLGFQVLKKAVHAKPVLVPLAVPVG